MSQQRLPALDGLRGFAVLIVLLFHVGGGAKSSFFPVHVAGEIIKGGWTGVTLFFVLSGFLITGILWDSKGSAHWWRNFYMRRVLRIFPLYYLSLLLVLITATFYGTFHVAISRIWSTALYLQNFPGIPERNMLYPGSPLVLRHFWSLAVEEQFYLIWPFVLLALRKRRQVMLVCVAVFVLSALFRLFVWTTATDSAEYAKLLLTRGGEMAAGSWLAMAYRDPLWSRLKTWAVGLLLFGLAGFAVSSFFAGSAAEDVPLVMIAGLPAITLGFTGLLVLTLEQPAVERLFSAGWLRWLGTFSYGIYVYQLLFVPFYGYVAVHLSGATSGLALQVAFAAATTICTLVCAWVSYRYFEAPFLKLKYLFVPRAEQRIPPALESVPSL